MKKLLIANRGEIAVRVTRAAREMGIATVAVYSDADADAIHTHLADEAIHIGGSAPSESYLNMERILGAAKDSKSDAIHPGYGFLSERAEFSEACESNGLVFVGPSGRSMRMLGAKVDAKRLAAREGVPIVPGFFEHGASVAQLKQAADQIGYPVMLKASAGGGGRGMRVVRDAEALEGELSMASDEALKAFGDGTMMVEKLVERPRHVEVQILADSHGNVVALFERECSLQRRHQKILEEAPSLVWSSSLRWEEMRDAAVKLAKAAGYRGAGTVEFMVDPREDKFYFLEVNARLQVEHPVTEMITGLDLVKWQLRIARGEKLDFAQQERYGIKGHAIEARIVAEDPAKNFLPSVGKILAWAEPKQPGLRVDTGYGLGAEVPRYYDSLLAKLIVQGSDRAEAISKLRQALLDFHILGVRTNIGYLLDVTAHPDYERGEVDTGFLGREFGEWTLPRPPSEIGGLLSFAGGASAQMETATAPMGVWQLDDSFRNARA